MKPEKIKEYLEIREKVRWLYHNTSCTVEQCAKHYGISSMKANYMIDGGDKEPKSIQEALKKLQKE